MAQATRYFLAEAEGFVLACGLGPVADLTAHRAVIHHRSHVRIPFGASFYKKNNEWHKPLVIFWRRQRDSNPRGVAPKRFSRLLRFVVSLGYFMAV